LGFTGSFTFLPVGVLVVDVKLLVFFLDVADEKVEVVVFVFFGEFGKVVLVFAKKVVDVLVVL
jgi:hypothetical protein